MKNYSNYETRKVVITVDRNETLARIFNDNNEVVSKGVAKCNPEDTFDFKTGAELAMKRAFESISKKVEWKVVKRDPKPGDYVRIIHSDYDFDGKKPIVKVNSIVGRLIKVKHSDHPDAKVRYADSSCPWVTDNFDWNYFRGEVEVVEPVDKDIKIINGKKFRKVDRVAKPGDYMRIVRSMFPLEKRGDIYKIHTVNERGDCVGVRHGDHPAHKKLFEGDEFFTDNYIWNHNLGMNVVEILEEVK